MPIACFLCARVQEMHTAELGPGGNAQPSPAALYATPPRFYPLKYWLPGIYCTDESVHSLAQPVSQVLQCLEPRCILLQRPRLRCAARKEVLEPTGRHRPKAVGVFRPPCRC